MDLERMTAKVRPRKGWEAIDLGVALVQKHAVALYKIWFITTLPVFLLGAVLFSNYSIWPYLVFWLLKPLWERPLLHFLSRELFGERLTVKDCVKQFFHLAKIQWFASLTWRRLSFTRSLDLPIIQLEGLSGTQRSQRLRVIHSIGAGSAVWLTLLFVCLEVIFYVSFIALAYLFLPAQWSDSIDVWQWLVAEEESALENFVLNLLTYFSVSIVAPFYTACGFALYLNQRTHLEAWDIELAFKRLAKRLTEQDYGASIRLAGIALTIGFIMMISPHQQLNAAEPTPTINESVSKSSSDSQPLPEENLPQSLAQLNHEQAEKMIADIKSGDTFHQKEADYRIQRRFTTEDTATEESDGRASPWWYFITKIISFGVELILWVVVALIVIFLVTKYRHIVLGLKLPEKQKKQRPKKLFGLDLESETIPSKPWLVALSLVEEKNYRQALSLLYRASLIWYIDHTEVVIKEGDTELECLKKLNRVSSSQAKVFMGLLTQQWRSLAYAHQIPTSQTLTELCQQWPKNFSKAESVEAVND